MTGPAVEVDERPARPSAGPGVGDLAPDFSLRDQFNEVVTLSDYRGEKAVLIVFYPLAFTGVCSGELAGIQAGLDGFANDRVQVLTVSVDSVPAHRVFAEQQGLEFPLLADFWPHGAVAARYDCFDAVAGIATRGTFLVDERGIIRWVERQGAGNVRDPGEWVRAIAGLPPVDQ